MPIAFIFSLALTLVCSVHPRYFPGRFDHSKVAHVILSPGPSIGFPFNPLSTLSSPNRVYKHSPLHLPQDRDANMESTFPIYYSRHYSPHHRGCSCWPLFKPEWRVRRLSGDAFGSIVLCSSRGVMTLRDTCCWLSTYLVLVLIYLIEYDLRISETTLLIQTHQEGVRRFPT